ncbi:MAG: HAMP domain-containing sensor histidine kinase [Kofleriaceae bacterium]
MRPSLRTRLLVGTIVAVAATFVAVGVVATQLTRSSMQAQFDDALVAKGEALASQVEEDDGKTTCEIDPKTLAANEAFEVWVDGKVLAKSPSLGTADLVPAADRAMTMATLPGGISAQQITLRGSPRREPDDHAKDGSEREEDDEKAAPRQLPAIAVVFARSTIEVEASTHRITEVLIGVGLVGIALCVVVMLLIIQTALAPVRALAGAIAAVRADELSARVENATTAAELVPIARRLDELLARLAAAFARERELTAEVGHELRTPLAGLRATLELALDRERPADKYRVALVQSLAITLETERVVEALLSLARLDAGQAVAHATPVDLDQLVRDVVPTIATRVTERNIELVTELEPVTLTTDRDKLRLVFVNLFDNAVTYANDGGEIHVTLIGSVLRVSNTGCTLGAEQTAHVFDRFWRADKARETGHVGIGLALCKKLVELLGGTIDVVVSDGRFIATVALP